MSFSPRRDPSSARDRVDPQRQFLGVPRVRREGPTSRLFVISSLKFAAATTSGTRIAKWFP